jgi:deoxyribodipyrimidine photo-lyase
VAAQGSYVLYWMTANRRLSHNFALDRAVEWARTLEQPLVILEALRCDYPWASGRVHRFVLDGMAEHHRRLAARGTLYYPYVEAAPGEGRGLLAALAQRAAVVVADDSPTFFLPKSLRAAAAAAPVRMEAVDSHGLVPVRAAGRYHSTAHSFRRFLQRELPAHLLDRPRRRPLAGTPLQPAVALPPVIARRWPAATKEVLAGKTLESIPIDRDVLPTCLRGGSASARKTWRQFRDERLDDYLTARRDPHADNTSGLSPFLHFGQLSTHEIFWDLMDRRGWAIDDASQSTAGHREGWWRVDPPEEAFLDQLITWREVAANAVVYLPRFDQYRSLPEWAKRTLEDHAGDARTPQYSARTLEAAETHDELWNATQRQLTREGRIHNYLRMLWGKKILQWSATPRHALRTMIHLNNKYALDGRDPSSYAGIFWVLGRYDRAWGPERPVFGKVRYMSSRNTARKIRVDRYVRRHTQPV